MAYFIFAGDMLVMAFMAGVVVWVSIRASDSSIRASATVVALERMKIPTDLRARTASSSGKPK